MHPDKLATSTNAKFGFTVRAGKPRFQCRLDGRPWSACQAPVSFSKLAAGSHSFSVRSVGPRGKHSKTARFRWQVLEPKDFSITPQLGGLGALYPGAPGSGAAADDHQPEPGADPRHQPAGQGNGRSARLRQRRKPRAERLERLQRGPDQGAGKRLGEPAGAGRLGAVDPAA